MECVLKYDRIVVEEDVDLLGFNEEERAWFWRALLAVPEERYVEPEVLAIYHGRKFGGNRKRHS